nr:DUF2975 domain-containing protein [Hyphomonas sp. Mor2]
MTESEIQKTRDTHRDLTFLAWVIVAILAINVSYFVGEEVGAIWFESSGDWLRIFNAWWIGIIKAMPTILIAFVAADFAFLFQRYSEGDVFTEANAKTLNKAAYGLVGAGIWAGVVTPTLIQWIGQEFRGVSIDFGDLALAVTMMGVMLHGLALVFKDAVRVKRENDEFV